MALREPLSARQAEVASLVAEGKSGRQIAKALFLSPRTVEDHITAIFNKLGVATRAELASALWAASAQVHDSAAPAAKTNVLAWESGLLARETDIAEICCLLENSRLVTVTGSGGIGKTRVAHAVGDAVADHFPAGVWLVALATRGTRHHVAAAIAEALNVEATPSRPILGSLIACMRRKHVLCIFDSCEHVAGEVAAIADALLGECPQVRILITSREPLRVAGERIYSLAPLAVLSADESRSLGAAQAARCPAIVLFAERARATDERFLLTDENASMVADICRLLDGVPLAIELAASHVSGLRPGALREMLDALARHQTMCALSDWSYDLLEPAEQRLFERLAIFAGGFDLAAATEIHADLADELEVLVMLSSLVDKSLITVKVRDREPRYRFLEFTRRYALDKLRAREDATPIALRHAQIALNIAERADAPALDSETTFAGLDAENWRAAVEWSFGTHGDIIVGQRLSVAIENIRPDISEDEGRRWLAVALALVDERTPASLKARLIAAEIGCR